MSTSVARRPALSIKSMTTATLTLLTVVMLATVSAGGTYALLDSRADAGSAATLTSGTATLAFTTPLSLPATAMYPGLTIRGAATVTNAGDVPLAVRIASLTGPTASTALSQSLTIGVAVATSVTACTNGSTNPTWTGTFAAATASTIGSPVAVGGSAILCVSVTVSTSAPNGSQGQSATGFGLTVDGTQV